MINVVLLVKDRYRLTMQTLHSLVKNTKGDFNLTVVDDEGLMSPSLQGFQNATYVRIRFSKGITGQARNLGVYWAEKYWGRGDWLYLSDNDVYFTKGWDEKMLSLFNRTLGGAGAIVSLLGGSTHPFHGINIIYPAGKLKFHTHDAVSGYSQLMRWETWDKYGPLDAHAPGIRQSEDWAFCQKIIKDGGLVGSIDPPVVYDCGLTDTFGEPAIGVDQIPRYEGVIQE